MANLDSASAVKALSSLAVDQAVKYKNSVKKDYQVLVKFLQIIQYTLAPASC